MGGRKRKRTSPPSNGTHTTSSEAGDDNRRLKRLRPHPHSPSPLPPVNVCSQPPSLTIPSPPVLSEPSKATSKAITNKLPPVLDTKLCQIPAPASVHHPVLSQFFSCLLSLHVYLKHVLVCSRRLGCLKRLGAIDKNTNAELLTLLDTTLVGLRKKINVGVVLDVADATQLSGGSRPLTCSQSEIVDLTLHTLFYRSNTRPLEAVYPGKPNNILAQGYRINNNTHSTHKFRAGPLGIDVVNFYPNTHVTTLKSRLWSGIFKIIGEEPMLDLLLNTSIFIKLDEVNDVSKSNYYQLTGPPISDSLNKPFPQDGPRGPAPTSGGSVRARSVSRSLKRSMTEIDSAVDAKRAKIVTNINGPNNQNTPIKGPSHVEIGKHRDLRTLGEIMFVRSRMFYSKPAYNARGEVVFGLRHIHVLNRFPNPSDRTHAIHVLKYVFPRQFNLHNVFTSTVDRKETIQPLKDYTLREHEIALQGGKGSFVPKRLKGKTFELVQRMMRLHRRCSYHALIKYYCPVWLCDQGVRDTRVSIPEVKKVIGSDRNKLVSQAPFPSSISGGTAPSSDFSPSKPKESFTDFASSIGEVSAFARAVISNIVPTEFWGSEDNEKVFLKNVDRFVHLRRYETLSLHEVMQGMKLTDFAWLSPSNTKDKKLSQSDSLKRTQILSEFVYYLFDSLLIPLLRSHFYVTESNIHRNRVFYFRHDVWKKLSEPTINKLKVEMFTELKSDQAKRILDSRKLGFSTVRLLPKETGIRPIMNLRKRGTVVERGRTILTQSINSIMTPVFNVLSFEKTRKPEALGSSLFNVREMYLKLRAFQKHLLSTHKTLPKLYFAKVDIQACFDTIPQKELLRVVNALLTDDEYRIHKYAEVKAPAPAGKIAKKFVAKGGSADDFGKFGDVIKDECNNGSRQRRGTIWVEDVVQAYKQRDQLMELLEEHVLVNIIKIGKKFFRQKSGIPQGSILSTILCNFFYGDLERKKLPFASAPTGVLLRLIDDFLFITIDRSHAEQFFQIMHQGHPEYGASVSADKSMSNFEVTVNGRKINRIIDTKEFPYCGNLIHTGTLGIRRDRERKVENVVDDTLTVEYSRNAGKCLHKKAVSAFKFQSHQIFFDTILTPFQTVLKNIYHNFIEAAMKFHRSCRALSTTTTSRHPSQTLLIKIISDVLDLAFVMVKNCQAEGGACVSRGQVRWLGAKAFKTVLARKQTSYRGLNEWLDGILRETEGKKSAGGGVKGLERRVEGFGIEPFLGFRY